METSSTGAKLRVTIRRFVNGAQEQVDILESELEALQIECDEAGDKILRCPPFIPRAIQLFSREEKLDGQWQELCVVDYGGEFLLRHYIGRNEPIELALGLDTASATTAYNEYVQDKGFDHKFLEDDLGLYLGHSYSHTA